MTISTRISLSEAERDLTSTSLTQEELLPSSTDSVSAPAPPFAPAPPADDSAALSLLPPLPPSIPINESAEAEVPADQEENPLEQIDESDLVTLQDVLDELFPGRPMRYLPPPSSRPLSASFMLLLTGSSSTAWSSRPVLLCSLFGRSSPIPICFCTPCSGTGTPQPLNLPRDLRAKLDPSFPSAVCKLLCACDLPSTLSLSPSPPPPSTGTPSAKSCEVRS
jgi:hypothetical protein